MDIKYTDADVPELIKERNLTDDKARFWAGDNISKYSEPVTKKNLLTNLHQV